MSGGDEAIGPVVPAPEGAPDRLQPPISPAAAPFWDATRDRRLVLQWCIACEAPIHFPREACPRCLGDQLEFRPASGTGTVYARSEMTAPGNAGMAGRAPYAVVLVDLAEGVRILSQLATGSDDAPIGSEVAVAWEPLADGRHLPLFARAPEP